MSTGHAFSSRNDWRPSVRESKGIQAYNWFRDSLGSDAPPWIDLAPAVRAAWMDAACFMYTLGESATESKGLEW